MALLSRLRDLVPIFNEETRVARYRVLEASVPSIAVPGGPIEVHGNDWAPRFALPGIVSSIPAVLTFGVEVSDAGTPIQVRVASGRGELLMREEVADTHRHTFHLVTGPGTLVEGGSASTDNEIIFNVGNTPDGSAGSARFFGAVVMYTSSSTTIRRRPVVQG